jgi:hypothetical protein
MLETILIAIAFSAGFFIESIAGFGGGLIAYTLLAFFIDLKTMIIAGLYIGTCSSFYIAYSDFKSFDKKVFRSIFPPAFFGTILGVMFFSKLDLSILKIFFGSLLLFLAFRLILFEKKQQESINKSASFFSKIFKKKMLLLGGFSQGAFGIGGPFIVNAIKNDFHSKSNLRTTMAVFFVSFNLVRIIQLSIEKQIDFNFILSIWWTIVPVAIAVKLGHFVHLKINDQIFRKIIASITLMSGIKFLFF